MIEGEQRHADDRGQQECQPIDKKPGNHFLNRSNIEKSVHEFRSVSLLQRPIVRLQES